MPGGQRDGGAVEFQRSQQRAAADRQHPLLPRDAQQQRVHRLRIAEQPLRQRGPAQETRPLRGGLPGDDPAVQPGIHPHVAVVHERRARLQVEVADHRRVLRAAPQHVRPGAHRQVCGQQQVRRPARDAHDIQPGIGDLHVRHDRSILLRKPREVQRADLAAFKVRRHCDNCTAGHDPAAADAGE